MYLSHLYYWLRAESSVYVHYIFTFRLINILRSSEIRRERGSKITDPLDLYWFFTGMVMLRICALNFSLTIISFGLLFFLLDYCFFLLDCFFFWIIFLGFFGLLFFLLDYCFFFRIIVFLLDYGFFYYCFFFRIIVFIIVILTFHNSRITKIEYISSIMAHNTNILRKKNVITMLSVLSNSVIMISKS
jgi:hypothetical protein